MDICIRPIAVSVRHIDTQRLDQMGSESCDCELCGEIDTGVGHTVSSSDNLPRNQKLYEQAELHLCIQYGERSRRQCVQSNGRRVSQAGAVCCCC